jgi:hypothetical protein
MLFKDTWDTCKDTCQHSNNCFNPIWIKKKKVVHNVRRDLIRLEWKALIIGRKEKKKKKKGMYIYSSLIIKQFERSLSSGLLIVAMFPSKTIIAIAMYTLH